MVVSSAYRGKGLGRLLMNTCEKLARELGFSVAYLSTHDKQEFYKRLGYEPSHPVCHFGSAPSPLTFNAVSLILL